MSILAGHMSFNVRSSSSIREPRLTRQVSPQRSGQSPHGSWIGSFRGGRGRRECGDDAVQRRDLGGG